MNAPPGLDLTAPLSAHLAGYPEFCAQVMIPSKERGLVAHSQPYGTQRYFRAGLSYALDHDIRQVVVLKGRQQGITTDCDALDLWWPQAHSGVQGMLVADDDPNLAFRRDVLRQMLATLPRAFRRGVRMDNQGILAFAAQPAKGFGGSRLMFGAAGKRSGGNLGRSRGINYAHCDEPSSWVDQRAVMAFQASLADRFEDRLYLWPSTARGFNVFKDLWEAAQAVPDQLALFIGWWLHDLYRLENVSAEVWERYGEPAPSNEELLYIVTVQARYGITVTPEQLAWRRHQLEAKFFGDETMLAQEHPWLPEDAFQAFGDIFIAPHVITRLRRALPAAPKPMGLRYEWGRYLPDVMTAQVELHEADLIVWEEPDPTGVYIVAAHPWGSTSPTATENVCHVWRAWPDRLRMVAEFQADSDLKMYQLAWVCLHLSGAYRTFVPPYLILDVGGAGLQVLAELERVERTGYGLPPADLSERARLASLLASITYLYRRLDSFAASYSKQAKLSGNESERLRVLYALRDELDREHLEIPSEATIQQLQMLRRGEDGDRDSIGGGAETPSSRAMCAGLAVEVWLSRAIEDLVTLVPPRDPPKGSARVESVLVRDFLSTLGGRG